MDQAPPPPNQYYLHQSPDSSPPEKYQRVEIGDWSLTFAESFEVEPLLRGTEVVGYAVGTIIDPAGVVEDRGIPLGPPDPNTPPGSQLEGRVRLLAGRFIVFFTSGSATRLYLDPAGSIPAVYDAEAGCVAASPSLLPNVDAESRFQRFLRSQVTWPLKSGGENSWLPGTLTYYEGVRQLLPNHYLDLDTWEPVRHWPRTEIATDRDAVANIASHLETTLSHVVNEYESPEVSLTAGKDSRCLLAGTRRLLNDHSISFFSIGRDPFNVDTEIAGRMADQFGLDWRSLPIIEASKAEQDEWLTRTGHMVGSTIRETYPTMRQLEGDVEIGGLGGEIGRGYLWRDSDTEMSSLDPEDLLWRFHRPDHPKLVATIDDWLGEVSHLDCFTVLDLAYQEHRLGCWGGPQHLGFSSNRDYFRPLWYRPIVEAVHTLDPEIRRRDKLPERLIDTLWPELNEFPYNTFDDWRRYVSSVKDVFDLSKLALSRPDIGLTYIKRAYRS